MNGEELKREWERVLTLARMVNDHYSMWEEQQEVVFKYAMQVPEHGVIVELGVAYGKTSVVMASAAKLRRLDYHSVDNFSLVGTADEYRGRLRALGLPFTLHEGKTQEIRWELSIDLMLVDAGHDEGNVRPDLEKWIPFVKPGGIVMFHDYEQGELDRAHPHWPVKFYADKHTGGWEDLEHVKQLKVRRRPRRE